MFGGMTREEIAHVVAALVAQTERRTRAALTYRDADKEVRRLAELLNGLVRTGQHEVSFDHLSETNPAPKVG